MGGGGRRRLPAGTDFLGYPPLLTAPLAHCRDTQTFHSMWRLRIFQISVWVCFLTYKHLCRTPSHKQVSFNKISQQWVLRSSLKPVHGAFPATNLSEEWGSLRTTDSLKWRHREKRESIYFHSLPETDQMLPREVSNLISEGVTADSSRELIKDLTEVFYQLCASLPISLTERI